jgi:uncharacterized membrane protein
MWKTLFSIGIILLALDLSYLFLFKNFMLRILKNVQKEEVEVRILSALACYIILVSGLYYFIIKKKAPPKDAFLLGVLINGVYETTNYAFFKNWSPLLVILDTLWGGILLSTTTFLYYKIAKS